MNRVRLTDAARERIHSLEQDGRITPHALVEDAKLTSSPLHEYFDWDVQDAAYKFWTYQARVLIQSVRMLPPVETTTLLVAPYYVRDPTVPGKVQGYVSMATLQKNPTEASQSMALEFARVEGALNRARALASVLGLQDELDDLIHHATHVRSLAEAMQQTPDVAATA